MMLHIDNEMSFLKVNDCFVIIAEQIIYYEITTNYVIVKFNVYYRKVVLYT